VRRIVASAAGGRGALAVVIVLAVAGVAGCGGGRDATTASAPPAATSAPPAATTAPSAVACRAVPRGTIRLIISHANRRTRFAAGSAAAVRTGDGYAVSLVAVAGGTKRMGTWFVDDLRAPRTVTSANAQALEITNWPLQALAPGPTRQSNLCATRNLRGPGPLAP
jgi:hypothetical protein